MIDLAVQIGIALVLLDLFFADLVHPSYRR